MQTRVLVFLALILVAIPVMGCAELIPTPNVRVTWTPTGDVDGNEFPAEATITQTVEYEIGGTGTWTTVPGAENVAYAGAGALHEAFWTLPDLQAYDFRIGLRVDWQGVTFVRYCETDAVQYFGIGDFACDVEADE